MSLNFGYFKETESKSPVIQPAQKNVLNYFFNYKAISKKLNKPDSLATGNPTVVMFCNVQLNNNASFTILTHTFDDDDTLTTLKLRYITKVYMLGNTTATLNLYDLDFADPNLGRCENVIFPGLNFKFKDIYPSGYQFIIGFEIYFKQISSENYGNESVMNVAVDF